MNDLDLIIHNNNTLSIKDPEKDIDISDSKWNFIFDKLIRNASVIYFGGQREQYMDNEFENTISYLSDNYFMDERENRRSQLLIKLKPFDFKYNRKLLAKLWSYYEQPRLIFLGDLNDQKELIRMLTGTYFIDEILDSINNVVFLHLLSELDVLWIRGNVNFSKLEA